MQQQQQQQQHLWFRANVFLFGLIHCAADDTKSLKLLILILMCFVSALYIVCKYIYEIQQSNDNNDADAANAATNADVALIIIMIKNESCEYDGLDMAWHFFFILNRIIVYSIHSCCYFFTVYLFWFYMNKN